jgi:predicted peroxiredoxin
MKILYLASSGASDPTRASIPLHVAVNGSVVEGQECAVAFLGDGTELILRANAERIEGVGIPSAKDLLEKLRVNEVPVYV